MIIEPQNEPTPISKSKELQILRDGSEMHALIRELYPICRSITGEGVRETLRILQDYIPLEAHEVASGSRVFDWTVPDEWNIREAWIKAPGGEKIVDFQMHNLHVVNYSEPVHKYLSLEALQEHLFSLPDHPEWIPYRTSYYKPFWGFCLQHRLREQLVAGEYEVYIDARKEPGHLTYGELLLPGKSAQEVLLYCHSCHPSLCNDNLSGIVVATALAQQLQKQQLRYSYRFVFGPGTIGSITWLAKNREAAKRISHGLVLANLGDAGNFTYKCSQQENASIDRIMRHLFEKEILRGSIRPFVPYGYDERQFCSPGFDLPVGRLTRTANGEFEEYHTSADNPDFVQPGQLMKATEALLKIINCIESNLSYRNLKPHGEPQLGKRGLYRQLGGMKDAGQFELSMLWLLNQANGERDLLQIAERSGLHLTELQQAATALIEADLLTAELPA